MANSMMNSIGGPLFTLKWMGLVCPCLEKEEATNARQALNQVNTACKRILWNTAAQKEKNSSWVGGFFGKSSASSKAAGQDDKNVMAVLRVQDSAESGYPEIFVDPIGKTKVVGYKLNIKLGRVHSVQVADATGDDIVLTAKLASGSAKGTKPKELLRFSVLQQQQQHDSSGDDDDTGHDNENLAIPSDQRNLLVHHLSVLVEWERQRRADNDWDDDEDEEDQPNFLQARAKKAAHFAQREIELQQTKREREKRKAKLVAESGGLKYTALAMANRID